MRFPLLSQLWFTWTWPQSLSHPAVLEGPRASSQHQITAVGSPRELPWGHWVPGDSAVNAMESSRWEETLRVTQYHWHPGSTSITTKPHPQVPHLHKCSTPERQPPPPWATSTNASCLCQGKCASDIELERAQVQGVPRWRWPQDCDSCHSSKTKDSRI